VYCFQNHLDLKRQAKGRLIIAPSLISNGIYVADT
jgi:hypothetical protein